MSRELTIEYIGPSDEDRAHLRLLMRRLGDGLVARWRWGEEQRADALFIDPVTLAGQMARARAHEGGVRCLLVGAPAEAANERSLPRPFRAEVLRGLLDAIAAERAAAMAAAPAAGIAPTDLALVDDPMAAAPPARIAGAVGPTSDDAEALYRRPLDPVPLPRLPSLAQLEAAGLDDAEPPTARSLHRAGRPADPVQPLRNSAETGSAEAGSGTRRAASLPLMAFLAEPLLGGPSRIEVEGLPPLALDPKENAFHSPAPLAALRPWLRREIPVAAWLALTGSQLRALREAEPARDYQHLRWLAALDAADGSLPRRLDPGGHFSLALPFEAAPDFPAHQRIVRALAEPIRLHELAAAAGTPMGTVFDTIAALDAIGVVACRPRQRLRVPDPEPRSGLFGRAIGGLKGIGLLP